MEQSELLHFVVTALERLGLRYFVTGSTVTIFYGEPRFTNDITGVLKTSGSEIDRAYIDRWAVTLGLVEIWQGILERVCRQGT